MEGDRRTTLSFGDAASFEVGLEIVIDADPKLEGDGYAPGAANGLLRNGGEQSRLHRDCGAATTPRYLANGTAEVQIDVVDLVFSDEPANDFSYDLRVHRVELQAAGFLLGVEACQVQGLGIALKQRPGGDHLADVEPGTKAAA